MIDKWRKGCYNCDFFIAIVDKKDPKRYTAHCILHDKKIDDELDDKAICDDFK